MSVTAPRTTLRVGKVGERLLRDDAVPKVKGDFDYSSDRGVVMMDNATMARHFGSQRPTGLTVYVRDGNRATAVRQQLLDRLDGAAGVYIYTNRSLREEVLRIFDRTFAVTYALQAIAITVALMGIVGTLMTLVIERRRDLVVLRAVGTTTRRRTFHCGIPSASPASRSDAGTSRTISSVVRMTIGSMMTASATAPARAENRRMGRTRIVYAKIPMTIDGTPLSASARKRTSRVSRRSRESAR